MRRRWLPSLLAALLLLLAAAEAGVLMLLPGGSVAPDDVSAADYFSAAQLDRGARYRGPQPWLQLLQLAITLAVLAVLATRPPGWLRRLVGGGSGRVLRRSALTAAAISLLLSAVVLPLRALARQRGIAVGLITSSWPAWVQDVALSAALNAGLLAVAAAAVVALMRRFPRGWWLPAAAVLVAGTASLVYVAPVVLDPLFNRFTPLQGPVRADVERLAARAGVNIGEVYVMDASRRTTAANAYVTGLGSTKRVVLYDTLLEGYPREEVRFVVAHELAHQHFGDVNRMVLYVLLVAPLGLLAAAIVLRNVPQWRRRTPQPEAGPAAGAQTVPALALIVALMVPAATAVSNQLSRGVEARADTFALQLTGDPQTMVEFRRRSAVRNVSDPEPPAISQWLLGTHPTTMQRIGAAEAWARGARP